MYDNIIDEKNQLILEPLNDFQLDSFTDSYISDGFCIFSSINDILYLIHSTELKSIIAYDLNNNQKIVEIKNAHEDYISSFKHILDQLQKKDYLMSVSYDSNCLKLWDIKNFECLCYIKDINPDGFLFCAHFLLENQKKQINLFILTTNCNFYHDSQPIKKYDLKGKEIDKINNSEGLDVLYLIDFIDPFSNKQFLLAGTKRSIISFDLEKNKIYHSYDDQTAGMHCNIIINSKREDGIIQMIESCTDGKIRIWDFHKMKLLQIINVSNTWLYGMCLWDNNIIFVGDGDKNIKLINLSRGEITKELYGNKERITTIKKIRLNKFGECLITQEYLKGGIKLWRISLKQ